MKKILYKITFAIFFISLFGCTKETIDLQPVGTLTQNGLFTSGADAVNALNAAYAPLARLGSGQRNLFMTMEEKSDDGFNTDADPSTDLNLESPSTLVVNTTWSSLFTTIQRANLVISNLNKVPFKQSELDAGLKVSIEGQALFLRALSYYWLVNMYGGVPIFTKYSENSDDAKVVQNTIPEVYAQIKTDLNNAALKLLPKSKMTGSAGFEKGRATQGAAYALLAEVHLILEEWQPAVDAANMVINSNEYTLRSTADYGKNFAGRDENGLESIFEIQYSDGQNNGPTSGLNDWYALPGTTLGNPRFGTPCTNDSAQLPGYPGSSGNGLMQEWENGDLRKDVSVSTFNGAKNPIDASKPPLWLTIKYFTGKTSIYGYANYVVLRYARTLLTKAEALNELNGGNSEAVSIINTIRGRAGLNPLPVNIAVDQNLLRNAIWKERRLELCFEGSRYFDLLRTGRFIPITEGIQGIPVPRSRVIKNPITNKDWYLWPIPENEISTNPQIKQNPGY